MILFIFLLCGQANSQEREGGAYLDLTSPLRGDWQLGAWSGKEDLRGRVAFAKTAISSNTYPDEKLERLDSYALKLTADYFFEKDFFSWFVYGGFESRYYEFERENGEAGNFLVNFALLGIGHEQYFSKHWYGGGNLGLTLPLTPLSDQALGEEDLRATRFVPHCFLYLGYRF